MSKGISIQGSDDFQQKLDENKDKYVMIDFWAEWCGPCKAVEPILDEISEDLEDQVTLLKVDIEDEDNRDLVQQYGVMSIPNLFVFKPVEETEDDEDVVREKSNLIGFRPKPFVLDWLKDLGADVEAAAA